MPGHADARLLRERLVRFVRISLSAVTPDQAERNREQRRPRAGCGEVVAPLGNPLVNQLRNLLDNPIGNRLRTLPENLLGNPHREPAQDPAREPARQPAE